MSPKLTEIILAGPPGDSARGAFHRQTKLIRAIQADLGDGDHSLDKVRASVDRAIADVTREFEQQEADRQADNADAELRRSAIEELTRPLRGCLGDDDWADLQQAIDGRFGQLPRGQRRSRYVKECQETMSPWSMQLDEADEQQRQVNEQERRHSKREWAKVGLTLKLPYGFPEDLRDQVPGRHVRQHRLGYRGRRRRSDRHRLMDVREEDASHGTGMTASGDQRIQSDRAGPVG